MQLESGEYFLKPTEKKRREERERKQMASLSSFHPCGSDTDKCGLCVQQTETTAKRRAERAEVFVAPVESAAPTVEEKRKRKRREAEAEVDGVDELPKEGKIGRASCRERV